MPLSSWLAMKEASVRRHTKKRRHLYDGSSEREAHLKGRLKNSANWVNFLSPSFSHTHPMVWRCNDTSRPLVSESQRLDTLGRTKERERMVSNCLSEKAKRKRRLEWRRFSSSSKWASFLRSWAAHSLWVRFFFVSKFHTHPHTIKDLTPHDGVVKQWERLTPLSLCWGRLSRSIREGRSWKIYDSLPHLFQHHHHYYRHCPSK